MAEIKPEKSTWNRNGTKYPNYTCPVCKYALVDDGSVDAEAAVKRHIAQLHPEPRSRGTTAAAPAARTAGDGGKD